MSSGGIEESESPIVEAAQDSKHGRSYEMKQAAIGTAH